jgi:hypothetical protein
VLLLVVDRSRDSLLPQLVKNSDNDKYGGIITDLNVVTVNSVLLIELDRDDLTPRMVTWRFVFPGSCDDGAAKFRKLPDCAELLNWLYDQRPDSAYR